MTNVILGVFFLLFGLMHLVETKIPGWPLGVLALVAGLLLLANGVGWWPRKPNG